MPDTTATPPAGSGDWLVFECSACSNPLKIRASQAGASLQCPSCHAEIIIPEAEDISAASAVRPTNAPLISEANPGAAPLAADPEAAAAEREYLAVDRLGGTKFRSINDPELAIPEEGIRVGKRKRRGAKPDPAKNVPEWDADPDAAPGGSIATNTGKNVTSATVKVEVREDGSVIEHRKKLTRKRLPKAVEKTWHFLSNMGLLSLVLLGLFVLCAAITAGWYLAQSKAPEVEKAAAAPEITERFFPSMDEGASAAQLVQKFLAADTLERKLAFVRYPEKVEPLMRLWYETRPIEPVQASQDELAASLTKFLYPSGMKIIVVTMLIEETKDYKFYAVESSPTYGLQLDWETAVGWQAMTVDEFRKGKPTTPQPFRVHIARGDYYNGPYSDDTEWMCCDLTYPGDADFHLYGYVLRQSPAGKRLNEMLAGQSVSAILGLAYRREGSDLKQVTIHGIISEEWFLKDGPAVGQLLQSDTDQPSSPSETPPDETPEPENPPSAQ